MKLNFAITIALLFAASAPAMDRLSDIDRQFIDAAAKANVAEIEDGSLAARQAYSPDVKKFADRMALEHRSSLYQLQTSSAKYGVNVQAGTSAARAGELEKFSALTGYDFDEQFIARQIKAHEQAIAMYQKESLEGRSPVLRRYATTTIPHLQQHLDMARNLEARIATGNPRATAQPQNVKSAPRRY